MQQYLDWATFIKLDNAASLDLLTSLTSALHEEAQISERDTDSLRQILNSKPADWYSDSEVWNAREQGIM